MTYYKELNGDIVFFEGNVLYTDEYSVLNPTEEQMLANGWLVYIEPEPTEQDLLQQAKSMKLKMIEIYDSNEGVNLFYLANQPMWLDAQTRLTLRTSIESYVAMGIENVTKWFSGHLFTFPTSVWLQMLNALEVYAAEALNVTEQHKADVLAMNNIEDVNNYDITSGYPEKLRFSAE